MRELEPATFDDAIAAEPVLIDFWAPWCRPCLAVEAVLEQLEDRFSVDRVNIDEHPELAARYEILSIPTVVLFVRGSERGRVVGLRPLAHFEGWLAEVLPGGELERLAVESHRDT
jgi:thioredoxin 1